MTAGGRGEMGTLPEQSKGNKGDGDGKAGSPRQLPRRQRKVGATPDSMSDQILDHETVIRIRRRPEPSSSISNVPGMMASKTNSPSPSTGSM